MYPVNDYLLVEKVQLSAVKQTESPRLYQPDQPELVGRCRVIKDVADYKVGMIVFAKVDDIIPVESVFAVKKEHVIARKAK